MKHNATSRSSRHPGGEAAAALKNRLTAAENVLAALEVDLDAELRFADWPGALTEQRLLVREPAGRLARVATRPQPASHCMLHDHAGVGTLDLLGPAGRLARWRFTLAGQIRCDAPGRALFEQHAPRPRGRQHSRAGEHADADEPPPDPELSRTSRRRPGCCCGCGRFARPYRRQLIARLRLTLVSTAATLVPPYLTMPLMDDVLIPFQNGQADRPDAGRAVPARPARRGAGRLGLGWARDLRAGAGVSERIGADLRTGTYAHLQRLSLEFFGGKRTGDLISRISSDTDRICNFLSLHLLDFATDVLMIVMTAVDPVLDRPAAGGRHAGAVSRSSPGWSTWCATGCARLRAAATGPGPR